jgi:hypothetical protein
MKWNLKGRSRLLVLGALALIAVSSLAAGVGTAALQAAPVNTAPPTISGTAKEGSTLTANRGTWTGTGTISYAYQWQRCDKDGGSCSSISGANEQTYVLKAVDNDDTLRVRVTATNADGSTSRTSVPTAVVTASATPAPAPATPDPGTGCPKTTQANEAVAVTDVKTPARLQITRFQMSLPRITRGVQTFTVRFHVGNTCGQPVKGANVNAAAVPYRQFSGTQGVTGNDGWVSLDFHRMAGFPAATKQQLLVMFVRASKPGDPVLAGISTRRLISLPVNLNG